jgi:hypothetical protein
VTSYRQAAEAAVPGFPTVPACEPLAVSGGARPFPASSSRSTVTTGGPFVENIHDRFRYRERHPAAFAPMMKQKPRADLACRSIATQANRQRLLHPRAIQRHGARHVAGKAKRFHSVHELCPNSKATEGNIDVAMKVTASLRMSRTRRADPRAPTDGSQQLRQGTGHRQRDATSDLMRAATCATQTKTATSLQGSPFRLVLRMW